MKKLILISTISITSIISIIAYLLINNEEKIEKEVLIENSQDTNKEDKNFEINNKKRDYAQERKERHKKAEETLKIARERMKYYENFKNEGIKRQALLKKQEKEKLIKKQKEEKYKLEERIKFLNNNINWHDKENKIAIGIELLKKNEITPEVIKLKEDFEKRQIELNNEILSYQYVRYSLEHIYEGVKLGLIEKVRIVDPEGNHYEFKVKEVRKISDNISVVSFYDEKYSKFEVFNDLYRGKTNKAENILSYYYGLGDEIKWIPIQIEEKGVYIQYKDNNTIGWDMSNELH